MRTEEQHLEKVVYLNDMRNYLKTLRDIASAPPIDDTISISDTLPYFLDYKGRKHIFFWLPQLLTLSFDEGNLGTYTVHPGSWINLGFATGTKIVTSGQATSVPIFVRCTNEIVP